MRDKKQGKQGKNAIVTGASRQAGIGAAIARALAEAGANVFVSYYHPYDAAQVWGSTEGEVEALLDELRSCGVNAEGLELDLSQASAAATLFDHAEASLGNIDILVNNAAHSERDGIDKLTAEGLDKHYAVNLRAAALLCAEFVRRFSGTSGRIINLSSGQSFGPMPGELAYAATKGAIEALTVSLSAEVAQRSITVNAVDPGVTDTGWITEDFKAELLHNAPLGRLGTPEDAARLVRFLASDEAGWITGQLIRSRGGL